MKRLLCAELASAVQARRNCAERLQRTIESNDLWFDKWTERIEMLCDLLPSGSGFDSRTKIDLDASHAEKLVFETSFHHINDAGFYDGWTEHTVTVTPSFRGINLRISGRNRNEIKDYISETFDYALTRDVSYEVLLERFPEQGITSKWEDKDSKPSQCYQAWYTSDGARFWNDWDSARKHAVEQMEAILGVRP